MSQKPQSGLASAEPRKPSGVRDSVPHLNEVTDPSQLDPNALGSIATRHLQRFSGQGYVWHLSPYQFSLEKRLAASLPQHEV